MNRLLIASAILATSLFIGCKQNKTTSTDVTNDTVEVADSLVTDTMSYHFKNEKAIVDIYIEMPENDSELGKAIEQFICADLNSNNAKTMFYGDDAKKVSHNKEAGSGRKLIAYYGKCNTEQLVSMWEENEVERENKTPYLMTYSFCKETETDKYVVYCRTTESYIGGAHGTTAIHYFTFAKPTGKNIKNVIDPSKLKDCQPILHKGVISYLTSTEQEVNEHNLHEFLFLEDPNIIPLPISTPYIQGDSLYFIYQQYEIGCYAMGMPSFSVALKDISKYMTKEAAVLCK